MCKSQCFSGFYLHHLQNVVITGTLQRVVHVKREKPVHLTLYSTPWALQCDLGSDAGSAAIHFLNWKAVLVMHVIVRSETVYAKEHSAGPGLEWIFSKSGMSLAALNIIHSSQPVTTTTTAHYSDLPLADRCFQGLSGPSQSRHLNSASPLLGGPDGRRFWNIQSLQNMP